MENRHIKLRGIQRVVAKKMEQSHTIPRVTTIREVRMDNVDALREKIRIQHPEKKVSYLTFAVAGLTSALEKYPIINSSLVDDEIVFHTDINVGVAITVGENLLVPVIKRVQEMSFYELNDAIAELTARARDGKLTTEDYEDGTVTITNSGSLGGEIFTPLINYPQSSILGIGRIVKKPIVDEWGEIVACPMMYLCFTYDHRIINGSQAVGLLSVIDEFFNSPLIRGL